MMELYSTRKYLTRTLAILAFGIAAWTTFSFSFTPLRTSHDEWWHLKTGKWITENRSLPEHDIFTYTADHMKWYNHEWLTQVGLWIIHEQGDRAGLGGIRAIILFKSICILIAFAGFGLLLARYVRDPVWAALAVMIAVALARRTFYPRPAFISYLLLTVVFWMLIQWRCDRRKEPWLWLLIPMFALWANLHGGWMAGLMVIGAFWLDALIMALIPKYGSISGRKAFLNLVGITALGIASGLAVLVNPYGYKLLVIFDHVLSDPYLMNTIGELQPPDWHFVWVLEGVILLMAGIALRPTAWLGWCVTAIVLPTLHFILHYPVDRYFPEVNPAWIHTVVALPVLILAARRSGAPGWIAHALLMCFFTQQAIHHVRHLSLMAIMILPTLAWGLDLWAGRLLDRYHGFSSHRKDDEPVFYRRTWNISWLSWVGLFIILILTEFWIFGDVARAISKRLPDDRRPPLEYPSYFQRNRMLLKGFSTQPTWIDTSTIPWVLEPPLPGGTYEAEAYPRRAVDFIVRAGLPSPLFNSGNYAGYLIWRLSPEKYRLFTDNRYDLFGDIVIREEHAVTHAWTEENIREAGVDASKGYYPWHEVLDRWKIQTMMIPVTWKVNALLADRDWARVWSGLQFNIWVRNTAENRPAIKNAAQLSVPLNVKIR
jgi:hypothetical protein